MENMKKFGEQKESIKYEIQDRMFIQRVLSFGQAAKIAPYFDGISLDELTKKDMLEKLGDKVGEVLEIILIPSGISMKEHLEYLEKISERPTERVKFFQSSLNIFEMGEIILDFLDCNRALSLIRLTKNPEQVIEELKAERERKPVIMKEQSPCLQEETRQEDLTHTV